MSRCTYCGSALHTVNLCPKTYAGSSARVHLRCTYCGGRDHNYEGCPKIRAAHTVKPENRILDKGRFFTDGYWP
jgi:hypothetical protein